MRRTPWRNLVLLLLLPLAACDWFGDDSDAGRLDLTQSWQTSSPAQARVDAAQLETAVAEAGAIPRMQSLLVVRDGRIILEEYFHGNERETLNDVRCAHHRESLG